ncbi:cytochrome P450 [Paraflavitalea soli]|nr:cytochrome P450 [Paraflavitalea soli]
MQPVLFPQSTVNNPFEIYARKLQESPVYRDEAQQVWGIYSYEHCLQLLTGNDAHIPALPVLPAGTLNDQVLTIIEHHTRLNNGTAHRSTREIAMGLYNARLPISPIGLLATSLSHKNLRNEIDWVQEVGKQLPLACMLQEFQFNEKDRESILMYIAVLVKIMVPDKTAQQIAAINAATREVYQLTERHILHTPSLYAIAHNVSKVSFPTALAMTVANLVGLMIQSYDAGRGILCNTLLQALQHRELAGQPGKEKAMGQLVMETLRYDPPVHHTRRVLTNDVLLHGQELKKGDTAILVLAAANRDAMHFERPDAFDIYRANNEAHLTFGAGAHRCMANHSTVRFATEILNYLLTRYPRLQLLTTEITYEPAMNVRLPKEMMLSLS